MMQLEQQHMMQHQQATSGGVTYPSGEEPICCLLDTGVRCQRPAGNASYNKQVRKMVIQKKLNLTNDSQVRHIYICDYHKAVILIARSKHQQNRDADDDSNDEDPDLPKVDFYQLPVNTLRRYKRHFKVPTRPGLNKAQLAEIMYKHFKLVPVDEKEIVTYFIYTVKTNGNRLDHKNGLNNEFI